MANNRVFGVRKSEFIGDTAIDDGATLDFVENNINKKITFSDFLPLLGTTGSIVQVGDSGGTPVLDIQGSVNGIRNLVSGSGVAVSLTGQNGIQFDSSFTFDETGARLVDDTGAATLNFRSIVGGSNITVTGTPGDITVDLDPSDVKPASEVIVNNLADLPTAVTGVITLVANTNYVLGANVSIGTDRLDVSAGGISWTSSNQFGNLLTYTGTGNMFSAQDVTFHIFEAHITCPNGTAFNFSSVASPGTQIPLMSAVQIDACAAVGTFTNMQSVVVENSLATNATQGLTIAGSAFSLISIVKFAMISTNAAFIGVDLGTSVTASGEIQNLLVFAPAGAIGIKGATNSANVAVDGLFTIRDCNFIGGMTQELSGLTSDDIRYSFMANSGIADTQPDAMISLDANATNTTIAASSSDGSNAVLVAGIWVEERKSHFTTTAAGRITYVGERPITTPIDVVVDIEPASGSNKNITTYIFINGSVILAAGRKVLTSSGDPLNVSCLWQAVLQPNDFIEVFVENNTDTTDILVSGAVFRVR